MLPYALLFVMIIDDDAAAAAVVNFSHQRGPCCCFEKNGRPLFLAFTLVSQIALLSFGTTG
jgi:hypothetical protein